MQNLALFVFSFLLGLRHATDPDHILAIAAITSQTKRTKDIVMRGLFWCLGHTITVFSVGIAIVLFGVVVPRHIAMLMELAAATMLIALGVYNVFASAHPERIVAPEPRDELALSSQAVFRPIAVGIVHGLAGSAAMALLAMTTIRSPWGALLYLALFAFGTAAGMAGITVLLGLSVAYAVDRFAHANRGLVVGSGLFSVAVGLFLIQQILQGKIAGQ